jgi:hypothetical protein
VLFTLRNIKIAQLLLSHQHSLVFSVILTDAFATQQLKAMATAYLRSIFNTIKHNMTNQGIVVISGN